MAVEPSVSRKERSPEKEGPAEERSAEPQDVSKNRVKALIERFEREKIHKVPAQIGVPKNRLGLRDTEKSSGRRIDSLINFFEGEDIKAREEARRSKEIRRRQEPSRAEGDSAQQLREAREESLRDVPLETLRVEETPESGEEREAEIMKAISGGESSFKDSSETVVVEPESSAPYYVSEGEEEEGSQQEELALPAMVPSLEGEMGLAGGLVWALGVGKYVCNSKVPFSRAISPVLSDGVLVLAPTEEQAAMLLHLSQGEVSEAIMDLVSSVLSQHH